ncbi:MAG TPA: glycosyltransferase family 4 protein [Lacunisphaera sp.]|nr:glycosyltransferase family 4 protein [Lacunisphaera sp.]
MRIALVSHEYPPETGGGGIGTYLAQVTVLLARAGHEVQVFAGSTGSSSRARLPGGGQLHRIATGRDQEFRSAVVLPFLTEHRALPFDVIEGTDFDASALEIKRALPELPYVVKLHTPRFVIDELHAHPPAGWPRLRMTLGALRRGQWPRTVPIREQAAAQAELAALRLADEIAAPSQAVANAALQWAPLDQDRISVFPYPYGPGPELLQISTGGTTNRITYLGRLEERKGVIDLADAIPLVLAQNPQARFRFVGRSMPHGPSGQDIQTFLQARLDRNAATVEFLGPRPPGEIRGLLAETDILAAPSHWESFGLVCCEGLAAARAVLGSANGGMAEILGNGRYGVLVPPHRPDAIARALLDLLADPARRQALGEAGRRHVLEHFTADRVVAAQVASYHRAIARARSQN